MSGTSKSSGAAAGAQIDTVLGEYAKGVVSGVLETVAGYATAAQKQAVEFAEAQGGTVYDAAKRQLEASGTAAADTFTRGVNTIIETQRTVLGVRDAA